MNINNSIGTLIAAAALVIFSTVTYATEHASGAATVKALENMTRLVESLGTRVNALEKQNRALEADLDSLRARDRALESSNQELNLKVGALKIPDVAPLQAQISSIEAKADKHSADASTVNSRLAGLESKLASLSAQSGALKSANAMLEQKVDEIKIPNIAAFEARLDALRTDVEKQERTIATANKKIASQDSAIESIKTVTASLASADSALEKHVAEIKLPDIAPLAKDLAAVKSAGAAQHEAVTALENNHAALAFGISDLQSASASLIDQHALLAKRVDAISVPDLAPLIAEIEAVKAVNESQTKAIDRLVSKEEALMVAATGLQAQIDDIELPDLTSVNEALSTLDKRQNALSSNVDSLKTAIAEHQSTISELEERDTALMVAATGLQTQIDELEIPDLTAVETELSALRSANEALADAAKVMQGQIGSFIALDVPQLSVDVDDLKTRLSGVTRVDATLRFDGMNIQLTSGAGATDAEVNGLGNLIIGYDEDIAPFLDDEKPASEKSGSHNLVVGKGHNYAGYGGIVAGRDNMMTGNYGLVAGTRNQALGDFSTVTGGQLNTASGWYASVSGGFRNLASANSASVSGGQLNIAAGEASSVSGGYQVRAPGNSNWAAGRLFQRQ